MPWPEPDPHDHKASTGERLGVIAYRFALMVLAVLLLAALAFGLSLPD